MGVGCWSFCVGGRGLLFALYGFRVVFDWVNRVSGRGSLRM